MNKKFIMLYDNNKILVIDTFFRQLLKVKEQIKLDNALIYIFDNNDIDIKEVFLSYVQDLLIDLKMYEAKEFNSDKALYSHINFIYKAYNKDFVKFHLYENNKTIIKELNHYDNTILRKEFLGKYYNDNIIIDTLKVFFTENQNLSKTAKKLYIHRNTLTQRLDKFVIETNLNPKIFLEALAIYNLLK